MKGEALTAQQKSFVVSFVSNGGNRQQAAKDAGYSDARTCSYRILQLPHVQRAIQAERERQVENGLATQALNTLSGLLNDDTPAHVRFQAARWLLEAAGHGAKNHVAEEAYEKPLSEMSLCELETVILGK